MHEAMVRQQMSHLPVVRAGAVARTRPILRRRLISRLLTRNPVAAIKDVLSFQLGLVPAHRQVGPKP